MQPELIVMHHTDCGMCRLANAAIQRQVAERLGVSVEEATSMAIIDPAHLFGLELGDAIVIRNGGGWITPAVLRDLAILGVLAANLPGPGAPNPELVAIHHTDCGMCRLANPAIQQQVAERLGIGVDEVTAMAITDPAASVQDDIEQLRQTPETPDQLIVSGFVYDVKNGTLNQVAPPAPLRTTTGRPANAPSPAMLAG